MIDPLVAIYVFLFLSTACLTLYYYVKVRQASREYKKAKKVLDDIVLSFNKELSIEGEKIREMSQKNNIKIVEALGIMAKIEPKVTNLEDRLKKIEETTSIITEDQEIRKKKIDDSLKKQIEPLKEAVVASVTMDGQESEILTIPPVIPILLKKESTFASLTETEIKILKLLSSQGEKTAVQIQNEIKLTREHTARLMKKLYLSGYIERQTDRTPYVYKLKKEMENFLESNK
jgi:hypothetical protein